MKLNTKYSNAFRLSWVMEGVRRAERKGESEGEQLEICEMMLCDSRDTGNSYLKTLILDFLISKFRYT